MQLLEALADALGLKGAASVAAGFAGSVISLAFIKGPMMMRLMMIFGGFASSMFMTPMVSNFSGMEARGESGIAFLVGLYAMSLVNESYTLIQSGQLQTVLKSWLRTITRRSDNE